MFYTKISYSVSKNAGKKDVDFRRTGTLKRVTEYPRIKPVWLQKWIFKISSGQIQNYLSAVPTDCCCSSDQMQQLLHDIDGKAVIPNSFRLSQ